MSKIAWITALECAKKEARLKGAGNTDEPLEHSQPLQEAEPMSLWVHIGDSRHNFKTEQYANGGA